MATYILVSGAWHASWCWERVVPLLESAGHRTFTPDLLGTEQDGTPLGAAILTRWADQVATIVADQDERVVLVGHSRAGIIISEVAQRIPEGISYLVYLAAFLVEPGETIDSTVAKLPSRRPANFLVPTDDGASIVHPDAIETTLYNTTEHVWVDRARSRMGAEPMAVFKTPLDLTADKFGSVKRAYIECSDDAAIPLALQRLMQRALPCEPVFTLAADHSPFYSVPELLAAVLATLTGR